MDILSDLYLSADSFCFVETNNTRSSMTNSIDTLSDNFINNVNGTTHEVSTENPESTDFPTVESKQETKRASVLSWIDSIPSAHELHVLSSPMALSTVDSPTTPVHPEDGSDQSVPSPMPTAPIPELDLVPHQANTIPTAPQEAISHLYTPPKAASIGLKPPQAQRGTCTQGQLGTDVHEPEGLARNRNVSCQESDRLTPPLCSSCDAQNMEEASDTAVEKAYAAHESSDDAPNPNTGTNSNDTITLPDELTDYYSSQKTNDTTSDSSSTSSCDSSTHGSAEEQEEEFLCEALCPNPTNLDLARRHETDVLIPHELRRTYSSSEDSFPNADVETLKKGVDDKMSFKNPADSSEERYSYGPHASYEASENNHDRSLPNTGNDIEESLSPSSADTETSQKDDTFQPLLHIVGSTCSSSEAHGSESEQSSEGSFESYRNDDPGTPFRRAYAKLRRQDYSISRTPYAIERTYSGFVEEETLEIAEELPASDCDEEKTLQKSVSSSSSDFGNVPVVDMDDMIQKERIIDIVDSTDIVDMDPNGVDVDPSGVKIADVVETADIVETVDIAGMNPNGVPYSSIGIGTGLIQLGSLPTHDFPSSCAEPKNTKEMTGSQLTATPGTNTAISPSSVCLSYVKSYKGQKGKRKKANPLKKAVWALRKLLRCASSRGDSSKKKSSERNFRSF